jgi:hypothetical protein
LFRVNSSTESGGRSEAPESVPVTPWSVMGSPVSAEPGKRSSVRKKESPTAVGRKSSQPW